MVCDRQKKFANIEEVVRKELNEPSSSRSSPLLDLIRGAMKKDKLRILISSLANLTTVVSFFFVGTVTFTFNDTALNPTRNCSINCFFSSIAITENWMLKAKKEKSLYRFTENQSSEKLSRNIWLFIVHPIAQLFTLNGRDNELRWGACMKRGIMKQSRSIMSSAMRWDGKLAMTGPAKHGFLWHR